MCIGGCGSGAPPQAVQTAANQATPQFQLPANLQPTLALAQQTIDKAATLKPIATPTTPVAPVGDPALKFDPASGHGNVGGAYGTTDDVDMSPIPGSFLWQGKYFYKVAPAGGVDILDRMQVENRARKAVSQHLLNEGFGAYAINSVQIRLVDPVADADLLRMDPGAYYVIDSGGTWADGTSGDIPSVMNRDGTTFVDPRIRFG
jgi:hypothetical protein